MAEGSTPEDALRFTSPRVAVNRVLYAGEHLDAVTPDSGHHFRSPNGHPSEARGKLLRLREPERRGATPAGGLRPHPAPTWCGHAGGECGCWNCRSSRWAKGHSRREESDEEEEEEEEEELEAPLPLRDESDWGDYCAGGHSQHFVHTCDGGGRSTIREQHAAGGHVLQPRWSNWGPAPHCFPRRYDGPPHAAVSVNVPRFSVPPAEDVSHVGVANLTSAGGNASAAHPRQRRRTVSLPEDCRKVFITYSSDVSEEILAFVDFLSKQGLRPAIDLLDNPARSVDINKWTDRNLKDPLTLIIIAVSPKYKADIEGSATDGHALHNKYIHSMMQSEFIQQGSLNFRFIPVLFLGGSQKLVPTWLQNTRVYRWPQDADDLLLRLLREERYAPPPVPPDLTLVITPVASPTSPAL